VNVKIVIKETVKNTLKHQIKHEKHTKTRIHSC